MMSIRRNGHCLRVPPLSFPIYWTIINVIVKKNFKNPYLFTTMHFDFLPPPSPYTLLYKKKISQYNIDSIFLLNCLHCSSPLANLLMTFIGQRDFLCIICYDTFITKLLILHMHSTIFIIFVLNKYVFGVLYICYFLV